MNQTLLKSIEIYATSSSEELVKFLSGLSKPTLISVLSDLLTLYMNDKNSSKLREMITAVISGYEFTTEKLGYNGYKMSAPGGTKVFCEIKPKNIDSCERKKLNGGGTFNDYTPERLKKDTQENPYILTSGFAKGRLLFILEFPFTCLKGKIETQLRRKFGDSMNRRAGDYLRSASFSFKDYKECKHLRKVYVSPHIDDFKDCVTRELYRFLKEEG